jgi:hypothetical protein
MKFQFLAPVVLWSTDLFLAKHKFVYISSEIIHSITKWILSSWHIYLQILLKSEKPILLLNSGQKIWKKS